MPIFAWGDVTDGIYMQAVTSSWTGAMAAIDAERYILSDNDLRTVDVRSVEASKSCNVATKVTEGNEESAKVQADEVSEGFEQLQKTLEDMRQSIELSADLGDEYHSGDLEDEMNHGPSQNTKSSLLEVEKEGGRHDGDSIDYFDVNNNEFLSVTAQVKDEI